MANRKAKVKMMIFTAPSGAGKTTIVRHLLEKFDFFGFSISATTRKRRPHEVDGVDYFFFSQKEFINKVNSGSFAEWEEVYDGLYYGTLKSEIERIGKEGKVVLFDIDVHGATKLKEHYGDQCLAVFVRPPSLQVLIERLKNRKTENEASLRKRVKKARKEMSFENNFDKVLVNDLLNVALKEAEVITRDFLDLDIDEDVDDKGNKN